MISRRELEGLIEREVVDLRHAESHLVKDYESLPRASAQERQAFVLSLHNLKRRARIVEALIEALGVASTSTPLAA
jgi:hypothetical protein